MKIIATLPAPVITVEGNTFTNGICDWSPNGKYFAWSCGNSFVQLLKIFTSPKDLSLSWSVVRTISTDSEVWSIAFGHQTPNMKENFRNHGRFRYHMFDDILATGLSNGRLRVWDANTGLLKLELVDHLSTVRDLNFAPESIFMMISGSNDGTIKFWDFHDDGNMTKTIRTPFSQVFCCRWSKDAKFVAAGGSNLQLCLWRVEDYALVRRFRGHTNYISKCDFSPDGTMIASSSLDTKVIVWNLSTGDAIAVLNHLLPEPSLMFAGGVNGSYVTWVSFCPNNISLVSICETGNIYHWNLDSHDKPVNESYMNGAYSCTFSKDGHYICVGSKTGQVRIISPPSTQLSLRQLCRNAIRRNMSLPALVEGAILPKTLQDYVLFT